ncbi:MAG TPA: hypothetical protein VFW76_12540, partial [Ktedonobacterales bacterium]|nr:hypothetical protein [Ktedonobacterales bacterium]
AVISALVLVAVAGGLIARAITSPSPNTTNSRQTFTSSTLHPAGNDAACTQDVAWSPDGAAVAFLGYQLSCPMSNPAAYAYHAGVIVLCDVASGSVTSRIKPDPIITAALGIKPPTIATPDPLSSQDNRDTSQQVVDYSHLLWSSDGKQLAVSFSVLLTTGVTRSGAFTTKLVEGVLLLSPSGGNTRVLSHTMARSEWYSGLWNLATGAYIPASDSRLQPDSANTGWNATQALMPPAPAYQWDGAGHLQATTASTATGQANGGKAFSVWQPGVARLISQVYSNNLQQPPKTLKTPVEVWEAPFAAWSANGQYLLAGSAIYGWRIAVPGQQTPDSATLARIGLENAPVLQPRDAALTAVLKSYHDLSQNPYGALSPIYLAWSPDGKRLAVETPVVRVLGQTPSEIKDFAIHIYDCASGNLLETLIPHLAVNGENSAAAFLRWSPDGSRLLLYNPLLSGAQIWGSRDLPQ